MSKSAETGDRRCRSSHHRPSGADFMVDILKSLGIEYVAANPGSSYAVFMKR